MTDTPAPLPPLTERQREVLTFISDFAERHGYRCSIREVMKFIGSTSPNGAMCHLLPLKKKGYITWNKSTARSIRPLEVCDAAS